MENERYIDHIATLLCRVAAGEADETERAELDEWAARSEGAGRFIRQVSNGHIPPEDVRHFMEIAEPEPEWREFCMRKAVARRRRTTRRIVRYAAAAVACLCLIMYLGRRTADLPVITSPVAQAVLELPDGTSVGLEDAPQSHDILERYGASDDGSMLSYDGTETADVAIQRLRVMAGGEFRLTLSDGTRVWVNSMTTLTYPSRFVDGERRVEVDGEAYFEVEHDGRPFVVEAGGMEILVTGTAFNVMAYGDGRAVETTLVEGGVSASTASRQLSLSPGQQAVLVREDGTLSVREVYTGHYTSWREGVFEFRSAPLSDIAGQLERWYDVEIVLDDPAIGDIRFTGAVKKANSLNYMLDILRLSHPLDYTIDGRKVTITTRQ